MKESRKKTSDEAYTNGVSVSNVDVAYRKITKTSTAFLIWRVENMSIVAVPRDQYGIFYDTDCYVIFASSPYGQPVGVDSVSREVKGTPLEYHIHFWLGCSTTPDKSGVVAYKTVELDNFLNGTAIQHRETQGNESPRFKSYFKSGFRILTSEFSLLTLPKLYKVKGKCTPVLIQMDNITWEKFNSSDIFVLHTPNVLFVWVGRASDAAEKLNAAKLATEMKEQYNIANIVFVDDGYEKTLQDDEKKEWNKCLPLEKRHVLPENESETLNFFQRSNNIRLYKCSENNGKYRVAEIKSGPLYQCDLDADEVFIIDQEIHGIWIWVGKRASDKERGEALRNARGFVKKKKYPNNTNVTRVVDGFESSEFKMLFSFWKDETNKANGRGGKPTVLVSKFDAVTMEERPSLAAETQLIDDGSGSVTLWRIKQHNLVEIPKERHGFFFNGDCYIVLYSYQTSAEERHLLYYWLGSHATQEEITYTNAKVLEIDEELGGLGFQARVIQGREPAHFLQLFKGKLIVFKGKGTDFDESGRNLKHPMQYFLQVFGSTLAGSKAVQIQPRASHLNSNYCYVFKRGKHAFIWCGHYSTGDQREMAKLFAGKDFELVLEGKEKPEFFDLLGGKAVYATQLVRDDGDVRPPRLFHCAKINGVLRAEEIFFFNQNDLLPENVMLVDFFTVLYLWIGNLSSKEDQRQSLLVALEYLQTDPCGRDMNIPIIQISQGYEPPTFTGFFPSWDNNLWKSYKSFGKRRQDIEMKNAKMNGKEINGYQKTSGHSDFDQYDKYPLNILKEPNDKLPARVDPLNKELHLTHDDFVSVLKMTYLEFEKLPRWKQQELKKRAGLF
ncbi:advillin isoform X4 [Tribolium castaneum]|uniref:advillin isoform X4 n=1 Tax=Tribolium castaneum TaxID=7070 RepID=UPI00046C37C5|nr:PREDICTED: advillin isoform X2 [Tribolium castaneum]|eukprot:XP_008194361.1 PREDICTED: advillin isoform X2 [Tribolium castaneum]